MNETNKERKITCCEHCKECYRYNEESQKKFECYGVCGRLFADMTVLEKYARVQKDDFCSWAVPREQ